MFALGAEPVVAAERGAAAPAPDLVHRAGPSARPSATGAPFIRFWSAEDYNAAPVNYDVLQHPRSGLLYAANNYGVLEFDGASWRLIDMPGGGVARALALDARGRVWVGGKDDIAVLEPDPRGRLRARAMAGQLPVAHRGFGLASFTASTAAGVYFGTARQVMFFALDGSAQVWPASQPIAGLTALGDTVVVTTAEGRLFAVSPGGLVPVAGSPTGRLLAAQPQPEGGWRVLTPTGPARLTRPGATPEPIGSEAAALFGSEPAESAVFLGDGRTAFGRVLGGIAVFDRSGRLLRKIDRAHGLSSNRVEHLCEDAEGGLWIAQRAGIARVQLDSPFAKHGFAQGVDGRPRALQRHNGRLYIAHNEGAAWRDDATGEFQAIEGLGIGLTRFVALGGRLLGTSNAIYEVTPEAVTLLLRRAVTPLVPLPGTPADRPWLLGGGAGNAWLFAPDGASWKTAGPLAHLPADVASLQPTPDGFVWGVSSDGRIWRMDFRDGPRLDVPVALYGPEQGVPPVRPRDAELFLLGSDLLATSSAWFLRYDAQSDRFVRETRIDGVPPDATVVRGHADAEGVLWLQLGPPGGQLVQIRPAGSGRWRAEPLAGPAVAGLVANRLYHDAATRTLWIASQGTLVSIDLTWKASRERPVPRVNLRRVETAAREVIFDGARDGAPASPVTLAHQSNTLRFTFVSPAFEGDVLGRAQTQYRTRLDGLEEGWTTWSTDTVREFSNLPFRAFTLRVEGRDPDGRRGPESAWAFAIAPPWWLTGWAMGGGALLGLAGIAGLVRWRTQQLHVRASALEAVVATRTEELRRSHDELARLHAIERDEKLAARLDEEKARLEILRYQLNPHFLYNTLASICGTARTNPDATRTMAQRLADFCRLTLTRPDEMDTVREEVRMLQSYLEIEKTRWRETLHVELGLVEEALDARLPPFLLLPLIENAIKHGGRTTRGTLRVRLSVDLDAAGALVIEVANTGVWDTASRDPNSTGIGLDNLRRRLSRYYPAAHAFTIGQDGDWVMARLRLAGDGTARPADRK